MASCSGETSTGSLGKVDIPHHASQARDEPGPFDAKDRFDRLVGHAVAEDLAHREGEKGQKRDEQADGWLGLIGIGK